MRFNTFRPTPGVIQAAAQTSANASDPKSYTVDSKTEAVLISVVTTSCFLTVDGTTPDATHGLVLPTGVVHFIPVGKGITLKFTSTAGANSVVSITELA